MALQFYVENLPIFAILVNIDVLLYVVIMVSKTCNHLSEINHMKKLLKFMPILLVALLAISFWSCDSDDNDEPISSNELPAKAKEFISSYFAPATIVSSQKDRNEYEVILSDGTKIDFDKNGGWTDVDALVGKSLPTGFYPPAIDTYILENFNGQGINEISKEKYGYDAELLNGTDLRFSYEGVFLGYDRD